LRRFFDSPYLLWIVLAVPGAWWLQGYWRGTLFYGEFVHASGVLSARLLIVTLALTPLARLFPRAASRDAGYSGPLARPLSWLRWLRRRRRYLGVATFAYALLHAAVYLERQQSFDRILEDAMAAAMWTGWVALVVLLVLAATSNDASVRRLGRRWPLLHRTVYVAAVLSFAHWILSAFDPVPGYIHLGILAGLEAIRLVPRPRAPAAPQTPAPSRSPDSPTAQARSPRPSP
jgi:sulfoxide reductase heme-binding subunit YedZ